VIHAAGNTDPNYFELCEDITYEKALAIFSSKISGVENLYKVFKNAPLDFVWIASSLSTVLGGLSFSSYSSANLFMDHFISSKLKELPTWKCIGLSEMMFNVEEGKRENQWNRKALTPPEITELFEWSISVNGIPVIFQTIENLSARIHKVYNVKKEIYLDTDRHAAVELKAERSRLSNEYVSPETESEKVLIQVMQDFFGYKDIGVTDNFFELGGDSLKAMILLRSIKNKFKVNFTLEDFFDAQNIRQMAAQIDEKLWLNQTTDTQFVSII
jgi:polyketide synthase PksN